MTPDFFVDALKTHCRDAAVDDCASLFEHPPGRRLAAELAVLSNWFKTLSETDRESVISAMRMAADATLFGVLCVIDGVRVIEDGSDKSTFQVTATVGGATSVISPNDTFLHDLLRAEP